MGQAWWLLGGRRCVALGQAWWLLGGMICVWGNSVPGAAAGGALGIMAFLPRHTSLAQLSKALPPGGCCEVERVVLNGHLKGVTLYVGQLARVMQCL